MKRLIICSMVLLLLIAGSMLSLATMSACTQTVAEAAIEVEELYLNGESEKAIKKADEMNSYWRNKYRVMSLFVETRRLDEISASAAKISPLVTAGNDEVGGEIESLCNMLTRLVQNEFPHFYNIM